MTTPRPSAGGSPPANHGRRGIQLASHIDETSIGSPAPIRLPIAGLTLDHEIQQRAQMDDALVTEYSETIAEWIASAPIVTFGAEHYVADGFHRVEAASRAGLESIPAIQHEGTRRDALLYAVGANAAHGKKRTREDLENAYQTAVREGLCDATDTESLAALLKVSSRWASELTREARELTKVERDETIQRLVQEGKSQREIAEELGIPKSTVDRLAPKRKTSEMGQAGADADPAVPKRKSSEMEHPEPVPQTKQPEPVIEVIQGDGHIRVQVETVTTCPPEKPQTPTRPADPPAAKGPTTLRASQLQSQVAGALTALYKDDARMLFDPDGKAVLDNLAGALDRYVDRFVAEIPAAYGEQLIAELRKVLDRLVARFEGQEGAAHE